MIQLNVKKLNKKNENIENNNELINEGRSSKIKK